MHSATPREPRPRRVRETPAVRREKILEEAIGLIGERGYYGFTVQELAKRCGLTNPGLLYYFPSKLHVMLAVLEEAETRDSEAFAPIVAAAERNLNAPGGRQRVLDVLHAIMEHGTAHQPIVRLLFGLQAESLDADHPAHQWWRRREQVLGALYQRLLEPYVADPAPVARNLIALLDGLCMQWLRDDLCTDVVAEWKQALKRFLPELHGEQT